MNDTSALTSRAFHLPKAGNTLAEYEDAFAADAARGRCAISDGASESSFADAWAQILVNAFVQTPGPWSGWLPDARKRWASQVQDRELPWYAEEKFLQGAYAALLGIAVAGGRWRAVAVGDCCLFHVRDGLMIRTFPMQHSGEFGNRPSLLGSRNRLPAQPRARRLRVQGTFQPGDEIFLMTDALAEWFLKTAEAGQKPWTTLPRIQDQQRFAAIIAKLRESKALRNDDVTLMMIQPQNP